ncbi:integral membrane protein [Rutstroemia sp. NJR-2017a WRK4]|nr:integral membrane protein [Rutstroemia sp. NJR-2017a WRK4]
MESKVPQILPVNILFFVLSWVAVLLRVYVRGILRPQFGSDDWLMMATQAFYTAYLACQLGGIANGTGRHIYDLELAKAQKALEFWFYCEIFYVLSACLLKISVGFFLLRITIKKYHIWILWTFIFGTGIFGTVYTLIVILQCHPVSAWWMIPERKGCVSPKVIAYMTYAASGINAVADWVFGLLPIFIIKDLQMSKRMKIVSFAFRMLLKSRVLMIFCVCSLDFREIITYADSSQGNTTDFALWTTVEVGVGIIAACGATLRPLLHLILVKTGHRPSSYKESSRDPNTGRTGRYAARNKAYPCGDTDNISMDELRPDLASHMSTTNISGRLDDTSPPSTSDQARTSLEQKNGFRASSNLSKSQSSVGNSPFDSMGTETERKDQIQVNMSLMVTYEDMDVELGQNSTAGMVGNTTEIHRSSRT